MSLSISSSDPAPALALVSAPSSWRRFVGVMLAVAAGVVAVLYAFVAVIDPWDTLPLSPVLPRVPISSNARYSFPALAREAKFNAAVLGTSTARLLRPMDLDPAFGAHFVNLAMNSATAWEQTELLGVFLRAHPRPRAVLIDVDGAWCGPTAERLTPRPFPAWMYQDNRWPAYREMLTPYAVQEAANQLMVMLGLKRQRYGSDGYTSFVPPDSDYDPVRVDRAFARWPPTDQTAVAPDSAQAFPALALLGPALAAVPEGTRVVLLFPPDHIEQQGEPGSRTAVRWSDCKQLVVGIAAGRATVLDMMIPSGITRDRGNYWDPLHYRAAVGQEIAAVLGRVVLARLGLGGMGLSEGGPDVRVLAP